MFARHKKKLIALAALVAAALWLFWPGFRYQDSFTRPAPYKPMLQSYGADLGHGNVVGVEPVMEVYDYTSAARFQAKISYYLEIAKAEGWLRADTIVLLPEHIATWLIATDMGSRVYSSDDATLPMLRMLASEPVEVIKSLVIFDDENALAAALFRARANVLAANIQTVFGSLAKDYGVTIVAGSAALMTAGIYDDGLTYGHGPIFNASFVFGPDGLPVEDAVRKAHPIPSEVGFTTKFPAKANPVFDGPSGKFAVLICADSWFDDTTGVAAANGASLLLVPAFLTGTDWDAPWGGYLNDAPANSSWLADKGVMTEGEAWVKYALPARAKAFGIKNGMTVFLKGTLWGNKGSGRAIILQDGNVSLGEGGGRQAAIHNLWLN